ncbi:xanthine dehydrogenase subunit E [Bacillus methanolicus PB1]|uniref:Xanthine dehydrogenase subunit E n=1 Tax=Bacillus methanolicus PB1 TaxID=997296 RepID=I3E1Q8_BACMT|nr:(2Fe-2S)-binding protein [Bacillus methanolicus]EIJ80429.1 xanthine dehydrogenase subunit E [Bacillus methanolicus PB1]
MADNKIVEKIKSPLEEKIKISLVVNGQEKELLVNATMRLADILREELQLTGTKVSCEIGRCGACSVIMDGKLVNSCLVRAYQANQKEILTIEGLGMNGLHPIQKAFLEEGGFQCGYCTPGMIIAVKALFDQYANPTKEQILEGLSGNLCRCTGYGGIIRAIQKLTES